MKEAFNTKLPDPPAKEFKRPFIPRLPIPNASIEVKTKVNPYRFRMPQKSVIAEVNDENDDLENGHPNLMVNEAKVYGNSCQMFSVEVKKFAPFSANTATLITP